MVYFTPDGQTEIAAVSLHHERDGIDRTDPLVYEVDPLKCPDCGGTMKIVALIDHNRQPDVVERILKHCNLWHDDKQRAPPAGPVATTREPSYDPEYFRRICG